MINFWVNVYLLEGPAPHHIPAARRRISAAGKALTE
jgi:hypothetical protein